MYMRLEGTWSRKGGGGESSVSLNKICVCLFGDCELVNTILGIQHYLYCTPPRCLLQLILRGIRVPPGFPVLPFNIQYWQKQYRVQAKSSRAAA